MTGGRPSDLLKAMNTDQMRLALARWGQVDDDYFDHHDDDHVAELYEHYIERTA